MSLPSHKGASTTPQERSCGAVVFTRDGDGTIRYVIIRSHEGLYGFPKGHCEGNETEEETALREIREETGLRPCLLPGFRWVDSYPLHGKPGVTKQVVYFVAEYSGQTPVPQESELSGLCLMPYEQAWNALQFASARRILAEANRFLRALFA